jgi:hypothetical protein
MFTLYIRERAGAPLTGTDLSRVRGAIRLKVVSEGMVREYPIKQSLASTHQPRGVSPVSGKADLWLQTAEQDIDIAKCQSAVALVVVGSADATIYWLDKGRCFEVSERVPAGRARLDVEERCCPAEYDLPPPIE